MYVIVSTVFGSVGVLQLIQNLFVQIPNTIFTVDKITPIHFQWGNHKVHLEKLHFRIWLNLYKLKHIITVNLPGLDIT